MPEGLVQPYAATLGIHGVLLSNAWAQRKLRLVARSAAALPAPAGLRDHLLVQHPPPIHAAPANRRFSAAASGAMMAVMGESGTETVTVREVGPRDGLQMARSVMPSSAKLRWIAAFGCSLQGGMPEADVVALAAVLVEAGADKVMLADTLGYASPRAIRHLVRAVRTEVGADRFGNLHLHDTMGTALANVLTALDEGVRGFDAASAELGGCPFAPGSVGNAATDDLVYLLESEGFDTGIDLPALIAARGALQAGLPDEPLQERVAAAGLPRTFSPARAA